MPDEPTRDPGAGNIVHKPLWGVVLLALAVLCFASLAAMMKYLTMRYYVPLVIAVRYMGNLLLMLAILGPRLGRRPVRTRRTVPVVVRACCLAAASLFAVSAVRILPWPRRRPSSTWAPWASYCWPGRCSASEWA